MGRAGIKPSPPKAAAVPASAKAADQPAPKKPAPGTMMGVGGVPAVPPNPPAKAPLPPVVTTPNANPRLTPKVIPTTGTLMGVSNPAVYEAKRKEEEESMGGSAAPLERTPTPSPDASSPGTYRLTRQSVKPDQLPGVKPPKPER